MSLRFPRSILRNAQSHSFTVGHGLMQRESYGGWEIPDFQRPLVWTTEQKVKFMESMILELPIGSYCYHDSAEMTREIMYTLLDGQQRWSAIYGYWDNEFPVFGMRYSDLTLSEQRWLKQRPFPAIVVRGLTYEEQKDVYLRLAYGGTPHEPLPQGQEGR